MCYGQEINVAVRAARKIHTCSWCGEKIEVKTKYKRWFGVVNRDVSVTKMHEECDKAFEDNLDQVTDGDGCWYSVTWQPRGGFDPDRV